MEEKEAVRLVRGVAVLDDMMLDGDEEVLDIRC